MRAVLPVQYFGLISQAGSSGPRGLSIYIVAASMFSIFQLDRPRKIAEIKIAVLVNILCVANSTQWNNFAQLKKKTCQHSSTCGLMVRCRYWVCRRRPFRVISNSHFCVLKSFSFCISQKGILSISSWFYYFF